MAISTRMEAVFQRLEECRLKSIAVSKSLHNLDMNKISILMLAVKQDTHNIMTMMDSIMMTVECTDTQNTTAHNNNEMAISSHPDNPSTKDDQAGGNVSPYTNTATYSSSEFCNAQDM